MGAEKENFVFLFHPFPPLSFPYKINKLEGGGGGGEEEEEKNGLKKKKKKKKKKTNQPNIDFWKIIWLIFFSKTENSYEDVFHRKIIRF